MSDHSSTPRVSVASDARVTHIYRALLQIYPPAFREAYGVEVAQVFRQLYRDAWARSGAWGALACCAAALGDVLVGALKEYLVLSLGVWKRSWVMNRMRSSAILVFCAYIAFVVLGMGFQKSSEDVVKSSVPVAHPGVALAYNAVVVGAVVALLATVAGGLPIAFAALRQAFTARRWGIVALFAVPPVALAIWLGWTFTLLAVIFPASRALVAAPTTPLDHVYVYSWIALFIIAAIASVAAVSVAVARSDLSPQVFRFALAPEVGVALGMLVTVGAIAFWGAQLNTYAPGYLATPDGPVGLRATLGAHLLADIILMSLATVIVIAGVIRGFSARQSTGAVA